MDINSINNWAKQSLGATAGVSAGADKGQRVAASVNSEAAANNAVQQQSSEQGGREQLQEAVGNIQEFVQSVQRNINFSLDDSSERVVVKVTDATSGEVIRQIPSEEALKLAESLSEARSLLFTAQV